MVQFRTVMLLNRLLQSLVSSLHCKSPSAVLGALSTCRYGLTMSELAV